MGGDLAPAVPVAAAAAAVAEHGLDIVLVGDPEALSATGSTLPFAASRGVIGMGEEGALAVRAKPEASIRVAVGLVADGRAGAVVSAGSTGATLAAALLGLGRLPGVRRPAIAAVLPVRGGGAGSGAVLVDAGGSTEVQPEGLLAHARMGVAYARARGVAAPRVGLLNVGTEAGKGSDLARAAGALLGGLTGFTGNVEPDGVLRGDVDVVVTDGFTGNILLKTVEALAGGGPDYGGPGAAVLLGVAGTVLVAHGAAGVSELVAALVTAEAVASEGLVDALGVLFHQTS